MGERGEDTTLLGRGRHVMDGLASLPVFVATMVITLTVFILQTIEGWQAITAAGMEGNLFWRLYQAATHDNLETAVGAAILSLISGNFVRFIWEVLMLFYDRARKFAQLQDAAQAKGEAIGEAKGRVEGEAIGEAKGRVEGEAIGEAKGRIEGRAEGRVEGHSEGRVEAIAEQDRKWQGWFARRDAAEKQGLPFDEPPPAPLS